MGLAWLNLLEIMEAILKNLGMDNLCSLFVNEKITPDIVCKLSMQEMKYLGINNSQDMMKLRLECINFGNVHVCKTFQTDSLHQPKYNISKETLENLIETGFKISDMSKLLCVSERTIYRRMNTFNLCRYEFTEIDDQSLQAEVKCVTDEFPRVGETMIKQILHQHGIKITRSRLRDVLHDIDQTGIRDRLRRRLHRRVYHVAAPNHLWHLDTNHKLIRWGFIVCGGIDGFSRFIVFLRCEDNNKATTILRHFLGATEKYGIPLRIRTDQGMENISVAEHMIRKRGMNAVIAGKSTHNQRIERLWRDVYEGVLCFYYDLFHFMEDENILDPLNEHHLAALHYVFIEKINEKLEIWMNAWARHRVRTVRASPLMLFTAGAANCPVEVPLVTDMHDGIEDYNVDTDATIVVDTRPSIDSLNLQITDECAHELEFNCPKNWSSNNFGTDVYLKALEIIQRQIHQ